jgi:putative membrane protein
VDPSDPRTYLAAERTFLAWIRTGLALMGFGFVAARFGLFLREELPVGATMPRHVGISLPVGVTLILIGVIVIICSGVRHHRFLSALDRGDFRSVFGSSFAFSIAAILALLGVGLAVYLWEM